MHNKSTIKSVAKELSINLAKTFLISVGILWLVVSLQDMHPFAYIGVVMYSVCMLLASTTVYLNLYESVRKSAAYSAFSFFISPILVLVLLQLSIGGFFFGIPFIYVHLYYFLRFRNMRNGLSKRKKTATAIIFTSIALIAIAGTYRHTHDANSDVYQGYVFDEGGKPIAQAKVRETQGSHTEALTDSCGYFRLNKSPDWISDLHFEKEGYLSEIRETIWHQHGETTEYSFFRIPGSVVLRKDTAAISSTRLYWEQLKGNWVLVDYFDNILKYKTIAKYRTNPLAQNVWAFCIEQDSLLSTGLVYGLALACNKPSSTNNDTLISMDVFGDMYALCYNSQSDRIIASNMSNPKEQYSYRRATGRLDRILTSTLFNYQIEDSIDQLLTENLLAGAYVSTSNNAPFILLKDGSVRGFKTYHTYDIHDFFGTSHPCGDNDAITFYDTLSSKEMMYNWKFSNETLTLTEMYTTNGGDSYYVGGKAYTFVPRR